MRIMILGAALVAGLPATAQAAVYTSPLYDASYLGGFIDRWTPPEDQIVTKIVMDVQWSAGSSWLLIAGDVSGPITVTNSGSVGGTLSFGEGWPMAGFGGGGSGSSTTVIQTPRTGSYGAYLSVSDTITITGDAVDTFLGFGKLYTVANVSGFVRPTTSAPGVEFQYLDDPYDLRSGGASFRLSYHTAVPEPATWLMMIAGFGLVGGAMRRRTPEANSTQRASPG